jgi:hypothetical protein
MFLPMDVVCIVKLAAGAVIQRMEQRFAPPKAA